MFKKNNHKQQPEKQQQTATNKNHIKHKATGEQQTSLITKTYNHVHMYLAEACKNVQWKT